MYENAREKFGKASVAGQTQPEDFYNFVLSKMPYVHNEFSTDATSTLMHLGAISEQKWYRERRPYYHLYPAVWEACLRMSEDRVDLKILNDDFGPVSVSCPLFASPRLIHCWGEKEIRVVAVYEATELGREDVKIDGHMAFINAAKDLATTGSSVIKDDGTIQTVHGSKEAAQTALRTAGCHTFFHIALLRMLTSCNDVLARNVLAADRQRYKLATPEVREVLEARALRKQGQIGYTIGEAYQEELDNAKARGEQAPHMRMPHPALYHVGKGRTEQVIIFRKGSVVHRDQIQKMPTGYHDREQSKDHNGEENHQEAGTETGQAVHPAEVQGSD